MENAVLYQGVNKTFVNFSNCLGNVHLFAFEAHVNGVHEAAVTGSTWKCCALTSDIY